MEPARSPKVSSANFLFICFTALGFEPDFLYPLENVTIAQGRDATFTCVVNNLGGYRVSGDSATARVCILFDWLSLAPKACPAPLVSLSIYLSVCLSPNTIYLSASLSICVSEHILFKRHFRAALDYLSLCIHYLLFRAHQHLGNIKMSPRMSIVHYSVASRRVLSADLCLKYLHNFSICERYVIFFSEASS